MAIIIALASLGIAIASMMFAKKTLKSQRQTEVNTTPIIQPSIQILLLKEILVKVFDGYMRLLSLKQLYDNNEYRSYVSEEKMTDLKIDNSNIHVELYYNDEMKYRCLQGLSNLIKEFNARIDVCIDHFKNPKINVLLLKNEIARLINKEVDILSTWSKVMCLVFGYNDAKQREVLDRVVERINTFEEEGKSQDSSPLFVSDNVFSLFYDTPEQKENLTSFMNKYSAAVISDFSSLLIER